ncbi:M48 family metalloprotease [Winogradskyella litoriviva]|uniref:M48 family metalloprotease n=1 Tax=Winogradskyella litoriviva TaxID=1220182 RepID=A0ABX2E465_9FLAO|nr:M48 family metalloprotease [Winogradskyella litoriviva]NRD23266.1 M48 family metalloprotease [Winogradskyella litoriviva]
MYSKYFKVLLFILLYQLNYAQEKVNEYIPEDIDKIENYLKRINSNFIDKIDGPFSSKVKKVFKDRDEKVLKSIEDSSYVFIPEIKEHLRVILSNIYSANPEIDTTDFSFFINHSMLPNAACYGDGMFQINLGLFTTLESDDELAFVICHEIAHKYLEHSLKNVSNVIATINSEDTKKKVKEIKRQKYGQTRAAMSVIDNLSIDILDHSKEVEAEADSLGFVFFSKTKYSKTKALSSLDKLKADDDDMFLNHHVNIDSVFNFESYPFKKYWLKETVSIFDSEEKINEFKLTSDTLKTHPEIEFRINKLREDFSIKDELVTDTQTEINKIKKIANPQSIKSAIDLKLLDLAIYQLIERFQNQQITSDYYYNTMAKVLKSIYEAKKQHHLGKYVPQINKFSDEKQLNTIRLFLHNLELNETKKIGWAFCQTQKDILLSNDEGVIVYNFFESINQ